MAAVRFAVPPVLSSAVRAVEGKVRCHKGAVALLFPRNPVARGRYGLTTTL